MAVLRNDIPSSWPDNMPKALARIPDIVSEDDWKGRPDIRDVPLMTIDGEDARDFDDAVYCHREGRGWKLYVAIADVSYYVRPGSVLDHEAVNRCNSCYFPNYVIPMLPEKLSNGICSLNPDVDRLCMCCEMDINEKGETTKYAFYPAVMRSHARLTYTEAWQMISEGTAKYPEHEAMIPHVKELYNLYHALDAYRKRRGGISIEGTEQHFVFNENMEITGVEPLERNDAHKLIEECMIAANVAAACFVAENRCQTLYRVHAAPTQGRVQPREHRALRTGPREVRPLHLPDPPLRRLAAAPRHQAHPGEAGQGPLGQDRPALLHQARAHGPGRALHRARDRRRHRRARGRLRARLHLP